MAEVVDGLGTTGQTDLLDSGFGFDLGPYTSLEFRMNLYEFTVFHPDLGRLGEFSANAFVPRLRLRYPVGDGRLVPYIAGGVGIGVSQFNDAGPATRDLPVKATTTAVPAPNIGLGVDYFVKRNLSVGLATSYQSMTRGGTIDGDTVDLRSRTFLVSLGLTYFLPEDPPAAAFRGVDWPPPDRDGPRPYVTIRAGSKQRLDHSFSDDASWAHGEALNAGSFGLDLNRRLGVEIAVENHEGVIKDSRRKIAEYATWMLIPRVRVKLGTSASTFTPYLVGGAGLGTTQINDESPRNIPEIRPVIAGSSSSLMGSVGGGVDIHAFDNMSIMIETTYVHYMSTIEAGGIAIDQDDSAIHISGGFRFYFR